LRMASSQQAGARKFWFWLSIGINIGFLGVFKYYNFFAESFADLLRMLGAQVSVHTLNIILPVGISFYTFHGLSYVIDIYKKRIEPEKNFIDYGLFVSFFPLLVAGPIERATHLLPQLKRDRSFNYDQASNGMKQILWGLFKKMVIADGCAEFSNLMFQNSADYSGSSLLLGSVFFTFQIYGDFSGYSDIAIGSARLLGIDLLRNFSYPYFSRDVAEFWRRWHISLSSWFRDYLYIPLGGSRVSMAKKIRNTFIIFIVSGFWHGANWTFIVWGALNALYILPSIVFETNRTNLDIVAKGKYLPSFRELIAMGITFTLTVIAWIFFRAESLGQAFSIVSEIFSSSLFTLPKFAAMSSGVRLSVLIVLFVLMEWMGREQTFAIENLGKRFHPAFRFALYYAILVLICLYGGAQQEFIYFQF
jgi:D-alanyl-lipoteichoic acid acyltransferase DltB (MBOAT superfamily)